MRKDFKMMTEEKNQTIEDYREQLILNIKGIERGKLRKMEESYLFVNFYQYISDMSYDNRIELNRQIKAMKKIKRNLRNNNITPSALYIDADKMIPWLERYIIKYNRMLSQPLPPLSSPNYAYLVRLVELFALDNNRVDWNLGLKLIVASYLVNYIRVRRGPNDEWIVPNIRNFDLRTYTQYTKSFSQDPKNTMTIDKELHMCVSNKTRKTALSYAKREKANSPNTYFPEVGIEKPQ